MISLENHLLYASNGDEEVVNIRKRNRAKHKKSIRAGEESAKRAVELKRMKIENSLIWAKTLSGSFEERLTMLLKHYEDDEITCSGSDVI